MLTKAFTPIINPSNKINIASKLNKNKQYLKKKIIPKEINQYDWKHFEAKPMASFLLIWLWYQETSKKDREKTS